MSDVKKFVVKKCERKDISNFIEKWHYSKSINGCMSDYCFALYSNDEMIGSMFYGRMAMAGQWKRFADNESEVIELRRLCCIDDTPKNTESFFIAKTLRWIRLNTKIKSVVSYADAEYGHTGIIYKASNFVLEGFRKGARVIDYKGKKYHDKCIRTKYKGDIKPFAKKIIIALENGDATYSTTIGKYCYVYKFKR